MGANPRPTMTAEEYLERERAAEFRSEYYGGYMYAMSGGSWAHAVAISNITAALVAALKKRDCTVAASDLRLKIPRSPMYTYPDVMVICGEPQFADGKKDMVLNPAVIVEVLSPSTEAYDRGLKAAEYRKIPSLRELVFVTQDGPRVELFRRQKEEAWIFIDSAGMDSVCRFESLDCAIGLSDIYHKITFEEHPFAPPSDG